MSAGSPGRPSPPPDPSPKAPRLKAPAGAIDAHHHLFGPLAEWPVVANTAYLPADALPETLIALHGRLGLSGGVLVSGGAYGRNPSHLADVMRRFPGYFRGIIVPPDEMETAEIRRLDDLGVRGVRFSAHHRGTHLAPILPDLARQIAEHGWHVQFYSGNGTLHEHADRLLALPNTIVIDHFGTIVPSRGLDQPAFGALLRMLDTGRVWAKLSGPMRCSDEDPPYRDMLPFAHALVRHAPERLVWGTDWPHISMWDQAMPNDADLLDLLLDQVPDEATRNRILVDNPRALYGFGPVAA